MKSIYNIVLENLMEGFKKRSGEFIPAYIYQDHPSFPFRAPKNKTPDELVSIFKEKRRKGIYRGKIGNSSYPLSYRFHPNGDFFTTSKNPKVLWAKGFDENDKVTTESGSHQYSFDIPSDDGKMKKGRVEIYHASSPTKEKRRGHMTTSHVAFTINGDYMDSGQVDKKHSISIFRTVLPAVRHHVRSVDPDIIMFSSGDKSLTNRSRSNLYSHLALKFMSKKGYRLRTASYHEDTAFTLEKRNISQKTARRYVEMLNDARKLAIKKKQAFKNEQKTKYKEEES